MFNMYDGTDDRVRLYLEIMERADSIGDKTISRMVRDRLDLREGTPPSPDGPCRILPFPGCAVPCGAMPCGALPEPIVDWPSEGKLLSETFNLIMVLAVITYMLHPFVDSWLVQLGIRNPWVL